MRCSIYEGIGREAEFGGHGVCQMVSEGAERGARWSLMSPRLERHVAPDWEVV